MTKEEFKRLFDNHFDSVRQYILYRSGNADLATDIAQETFMKVWEKKAKFNLGTSKRLLFKIANDFFISDYRREKLSFGILKHFEIQQEDYSPQEVLEFRQLKAGYEKALEAMGEKQRVVFLMSRIDGRTYSEIAGTLGLSVKAIEKRMNQALVFLRKSINRDE